MYVDSLVAALGLCVACDDQVGSERSKWGGGDKKHFPIFRINTPPIVSCNTVPILISMGI